MHKGTVERAQTQLGGSYLSACQLCSRCSVHKVKLTTLPSSPSVRNKSAAPECFGSRDRFCERQMFHGRWGEEGRETVSGWFKHVGGWLQREMKLHSLTHHSPLLGNYFPTGHRPVMVHGPGVGDPWIKWDVNWEAAVMIGNSSSSSSSNSNTSSSSSMASTKIIDTAPSERKSRDGAEFRLTGSAAPELVAPVLWWEGQLHPGLRCSFWCLLLKVRSWLLVQSKLHAPWVLLFPSWEATLASWRMIFFYTEVWCHSFITTQVTPFTHFISSLIPLVTSTLFSVSVCLLLFSLACSFILFAIFHIWVESYDLCFSIWHIT